MKISYIFFIFLLSCVPEKESVDAIYYNAYIYSSDTTSKPFRGGIAILSNTIIALDSSHKILLKYDSKIKEDLDLISIYPSEKNTIKLGEVASIRFEE